MSTPVSLVEKQKRTRKSHTKVRTGCLTCKIRRKKCGEEKPACLRCTSTGRRCDGYPPSPNESATQSVAPPTPPTSPAKSPVTWIDTDFSPVDFHIEIPPSLPSASQQWEVMITSLEPIGDFNDLSEEWDGGSALLINPTTDSFATDRDCYSFDFFCKKTSPMFTHYLETTMWQGPTMRASYHPAVRQAMIALGAVHRRFELGITPEAFEYCDFSMKSYAKALAAAQETIRAEDPSIVDVTMILCWILGAFEAFQGNSETASRYLQGGLKAFFAQKFSTIQSKIERRSPALNEKNIRLLFAKLERKSNEIFKAPARIIRQCSNDIDLPDCPSHLYTLEHARDSLFTQIYCILYFVTSTPREIGGRLAQRKLHVTRLLQWTAAYASLCQTLASQVSVYDSRRAAASSLLRVCREIAFLLLLIQAGAKNCPKLDDFLSEGKTPCESGKRLNAYFAKLVMRAERILSSNAQGFGKSIKQLSFHVDSGINPPLFLAGTPCRSTKVRHQALDLIQDSAQDSQVWDRLGAWSIAEKTSMIEGSVALRCGALPADISERGALWVDVMVFLEERKLLRSYCVPETGTGVDGLMWVQEWITF